MGFDTFSPKYDSYLCQSSKKCSDTNKTIVGIYVSEQRLEIFTNNYAMLTMKSPYYGPQFCHSLPKNIIKW